MPKAASARPIWTHIALIYLASVVAVILVIFGVFSVAFAGEIYPRVSVAGVMVGGLKPEAAKAKLEEQLKNQALQPVILTTEAGRSFTIKPETIEATYDIDQSVAKAMAIGRDQVWFTSLTQKLTSPLFGFDLPAAVKVNDQAHDRSLEEIVKTVNVPEKNAALVIKNGIASISAAETSQTIELKQLRPQVLAAFGNSQDRTISLKLAKKEPKVNEAAVESAKKQAEAILAEAISLTHQDKKYTASPADIGNWLTTKEVTQFLKTRLELDYDLAKIDQFIGEIANQIDQEPVNARLAVTGGQINIIESSKDGQKLNREAAKTDLIKILAIRQEIPAIKTSPSQSSAEPAASSTGSAEPSASPSPNLPASEVVLRVEVKKPDVTNDNISSVGIKERIAVSTTDFKGSPANRQENIKVGTRLFNGIILKPGQQFSAVKSLGRIDESAGFKPELVIKQDQLATEVGGGLCQVSTTFFRAAMNAGLQIDERKNHRFRVGYYEAKPANPDPEDYVTNNAKTLVGIDATIYDPSPDLKVTNDTGNYLLVQARIEGTRLTVELFGTKDGRKVSVDGPYITSTTPAPSEIQYIDDPTLPTGQTKQKEKAVAGAKTSFTYLVEKDGNTLHKNTFTSSYTAWQAKFYRGTGPAVASPSPSPVAVSPSPVATESPATTNN